MDRVISLEASRTSLEASRQKHEQTLYGDDEDKPGLVGMMRQIIWWAKIIATGIGIIFATMIAKWTETKLIPGPHQSINQTVGTGADTPAAAEYDSKQLASMMGYSVREIQDRAARGEIPGARKDGKEWRFDRAKVDAALAAKAVKDASAVSAAP